jgi:hypothetical protein
MADPAQRTSLDLADAALKLTPQEKYLYQHHLSNIATRQGTNNPGGDYSSVKQASVEIDGKTYNLPTIWHGKELPVPDAIKMAKAQGLHNWPAYSTEDEAMQRYNQMHKYMAMDKPLPPVAKTPPNPYDELLKEE